MKAFHIVVTTCALLGVGGLALSLPPGAHAQMSLGSSPVSSGMGSGGAMLSGAIRGGRPQPSTAPTSGAVQMHPIGPPAIRPPYMSFEQSGGLQYYAQPGPVLNTGADGWRNQTNTPGPLYDYGPPNRVYSVPGIPDSSAVQGIPNSSAVQGIPSSSAVQSFGGWPTASNYQLRSRPPMIGSNPPAHGLRYIPDVQPEHHKHFRGGWGDSFYGSYAFDDTSGCYPDVYAAYPGFPGFIVPQAALVSYCPPPFVGFVGNFIPFSAPDYQNYQVQSLYDYYDLATTQNPFIYHGPLNTYQGPPANQQAQTFEVQPSEPQPAPPADNEGQPQTPPAAGSPYPAGSYKEAFADIQQGWNSSDIAPIKKHLRDNDVKIAISLKGQYAYSIASSDWADLTKDAFDHLQTVSFQFTVLRFQKNGDITGYATHIYTGKSGEDETMYVSYTLRHRNDEWYIVAVGTSSSPLIPEQKDGDIPAPSSNSSSSSDSTPTPTNATTDKSGDLVISN